MAMVATVSALGRTPEYPASERNGDTRNQEYCHFCCCCTPYRPATI